MAWLCVDENGEHIFCEEPLRGRTQKYVSFYREHLIRQQSSKLQYANADDIDDVGFIIYAEEGIDLPKGSIKKLIGRELSWQDEPVELKEEQLMYRPITMYQIVCDRCGEVFGGTDTCSALFSNKEVDIGDYSDWEMIDGKHYCPDCYEVEVIDGVYNVKAKEKQVWKY